MRALRQQPDRLDTAALQNLAKDRFVIALHCQLPPQLDNAG